MNIDYFKIEHNQIAPRAGKVLISEPFSQDSYFKRSVVLLTEHNADGSVGFILNKPVQLKVTDVLSDFPNIGAQLSVGGPVASDTVHYIHTLGHLVPNSVQIQENLYWGGDFEVLKLMAESDTLTADQIRFFIGYSGWQEKQLDAEIAQNFWLVSNLSIPEIMDTNIDNIWKSSLDQLGERYRMWGNFPENPNLN